MSVVTNVTILCGLIEEAAEGSGVPGIQFINQYLERNKKGTLNDISSYAGGKKGMETFLYAGAFNYLDKKEFIEAFNAAPWVDDNAQLLIKEQEAANYSLIVLRSENKG